jgi:hypothetical protein
MFSSFKPAFSSHTRSTEQAATSNIANLLSYGQPTHISHPEYFRNPSEVNKKNIKYKTANCSNFKVNGVANLSHFIFWALLPVITVILRNI